ncbi:hypothetical protein [Schlesneria sp. T3-172]|uniref:hypothetical protein n=1 Tax=Schlesneria sphaerica TaxID=3373610 RepID=UPI0037CBA708
MNRFAAVVFGRVQLLIACNRKRSNSSNLRELPDLIEGERRKAVVKLDLPFGEPFSEALARDRAAVSICVRSEGGDGDFSATRTRDLHHPVCQVLLIRAKEVNNAVAGAIYGHLENQNFNPAALQIEDRDERVFRGTLACGTRWTAIA